MFFLSTGEIKTWKTLSEYILKEQSEPSEDFYKEIHLNLKAPFHFFIGCLLASSGFIELAKKWFIKGVFFEEGGVFANTFMLSFLKRHNDRLIKPAIVFNDPKPYIHFTTTSLIKKSRENFLLHCSHSVPRFKKPFRFMDIGCGDGSLTVDFLKNLREFGLIGDIEEILLIDSSAGMLIVAEDIVRENFPDSEIRIVNQRFEDYSSKIDRKYDLALSSLAYHHMPYEKKLINLKILRNFIEYFVLFELSANNDTPQLNSPEMLCSLYQSYGKLIDFVFSNDAPIELAEICVDNFIMVELVSFLTEVRGLRSDYHMLRVQWHDLFLKGLGPALTCLTNSSAYSDEYIELFTMIYGK